MLRLVGTSGCPPLPLSRRFRRRLQFLPAAVHRQLAPTVSSSPSSAPLQSATVPDPPHLRTLRFSSEAAPMGFPCSPPRDIHQQRPVCRASQSRHAPSSTFLTSSTVFSATGFAGLFRPAATSRVLPSGVCSPHRASATSSVTAALSPLPMTRYRRLPAGATRHLLVLRASFSVRIRATTDGV
jgi:hypothetical protein